MNNSGLLTGLLAATLWGGGVMAHASVPDVVTLEEIFKVAEANSVQLRPYLVAQEEADNEIGVARNARLPEINANLSVSYIGDGFITDRDFTNYQKAPIPHFGSGAGVTVEQPVYTGGAVTSSIKMAELKSDAARHATDFQRDNLRFRLTGFYLDIYKQFNLRKVVEKNIEQAQIVLEQMRSRYEQGTALQNDITRYELLVSNLELQLIKINNTIEILNENLTVTAGFPKGTVINPDPEILSRALSANGESWWTGQAETSSPALKLARSGVEISQRAESLVKADRLPKIGLRAAWTLDGPILVEIPPINRNLSYWYVGIGVSYNISSLYKSNKSLSKSRATTLKSLRQLDATREEITLAIRSDYVRYMEAYQELATQEKSVELAERNYRTTSTRYNEDMALITDMLDAANSLLDAEQRRVNARIDIIYYYYKLLFTSGTI